MAASSIRRELTLWVFTGLALGVLIAAIGTYLRARDEANALFDYQLKEMAASLTDAPFAPGPLPGVGGAPGADALVVQIWDRNGVQLYLSQPRRDLPQNAQLGFTDVHTSGGDWRIFSTLAAGQVVQIAQPMSARRDLATSMALRTIVPLLAVLPFLALLIAYTIARGLKPLARVADAVASRSPASLEALPDHGLPAEVTPLVHALNGLLQRLQHGLDAQKSFIADAAHELRTPLTAVHLQAQLAERAGTEAERSAAMRELKSGLARATHLVEQLLTLARQEPGVAEPPLRDVDLTGLARSTIEDMAPLAAAKKVDLGLEIEAAQPDGGSAVRAQAAVCARGDPDALRTLLTNLVDNALRYTPPGGRVDVSVGREAGTARSPWDGAHAAPLGSAEPAAARTGNRSFLSVSDSGLGIAAEERERVFDRFYRGRAAAASDPVHGSGLGLAIVKSIAERHGAEVSLGPGLEGQGLSVRVSFPPDAA